MVDRIALLLALAAILAVAAPLSRHAFEREFTVREATFASALSARADGAKDLVSDDATRPALSSLRAMSLVVGLTERPLRMMVLLFAAAGILAAALAMGEILGGVAACVVIALAAASPFLGDAVLDPMLLGFGAGGLLVAGTPALAGRSLAWLLAPFLGVLATVALDPRGIGAVAALLGALLFLPAPGRRRGAAFLSCLLGAGAGLFVSGRAGALFDVVKAQVPDAGTGAATLLFVDTRPIAATGAVLVALVACGAFIRSPGLGGVRTAAVVVLCSMIAFCALSPTGTGMLEGSGFSLFALPLAALGAAGLVALPAGLRALVPVLIVGAVLADRGIESWTRLRDAGSGAVEATPLKTLWEAVRPEAHATGRVLLRGDARHALRHYSGRGLAPAAPILLIPEDLALEDLESGLRDRLSVKPGEEERSPVVFLHPPLEDLPPGLAVEDGRPAPPGWQRLVLAAR